MYAAKEGHNETVLNVLIKHGADVGMQNENGRYNKLKIVKCLLSIVLMLLYYLLHKTTNKKDEAQQTI